MKGQKIIVTGGLGFIGSNLVKELIEENEVIIIDDLSSGKLENAEHHNKDNLKLIKGSITDLDLKKIFRDSDYVFHEAALISVPESVKKPLTYNEVNVNGTLKVLIAARDSDVKKVVFASSAAVYGDSRQLPIIEDIPLQPQSPYAVNKATGELYCNVFTENYGLSTVSLRYFNVFGPRQDPNSAYAAVIPNFIQSILKGEKPVIYGDGEQSRDFISVKQVVKANIKACMSSKVGVYNVALGRSTTINQLLEMINQCMGTQVEPVYMDPRPGDVKHSLADISRARTFGFNPEDDFIDDLAETVKWFTEFTEYYNKPKL
ncbi:MAG TPA: SDR family oxidoreductase [Methanobacterium sp.]|nr:SDR family oxidoreductase [Methanobacterium sp.]